MKIKSIEIPKIKEDSSYYYYDNCIAELFENVNIKVFGRFLISEECNKQVLNCSVISSKEVLDDGSFKDVSLSAFILTELTSAICSFIEDKLKLKK